MSAEFSRLVVVDTNVLLAATDTSRTQHEAAIAFLTEDERTLALTPQIVREYLAVSTRPLDANGLGMSGAHARDNINQFLGDMRLLSEDAAAVQGVLAFVADGIAAGKQVHDANIVAVALAHSAGAIVTDNTAHFDRFSDLIDVESLDR